MAKEEAGLFEEEPKDEPQTQEPAPEPAEIQPELDSQPSAYERLGLKDIGFDEKEFANADAFTVAERLRDRVKSEEERVAQRLSEAQAAWQREIVNTPSWIKYQQREREEATRQPEPETDPLADWYKPPEFNQALLEANIERRVALDAEGNPLRDAYGKPIIEIEWRADADPAVKKAYQEHHAYKKKWQEDFFEDPRGTLAKLVQHEAKSIARESLNQFARDYDERQFFDKFTAETGPNVKWMYEHNPTTGEIVRSHLNDDPILTDLAKRLFANAADLYQRGGIEHGGRLTKADCVRQAHMAMLGEVSLQRELAAQANANAKEVHDQEKRGVKTPNRRGSFSQPENNKRPAQTGRFSDLLRQDMDQRGLSEDVFMQPLS